VGGLGPSSLGVTKWETVISLKSRTHISRTKKYEGFGGRPPVGGRPAWGPGPLPPPLNPALILLAIMCKHVSRKTGST